MIPFNAKRTLQLLGPYSVNYSKVMFFFNYCSFSLGGGYGIEFLWEYFKHAYPNATTATTHKYQYSIYLKVQILYKFQFTFWIFIFLNSQMLRSPILKRLFSTVSIKLNAQKKAVQVTLVNSKKRNPLSIQTMNQLYEKLIQVEKYSSTEQARIMILKGEGPAFSAGHDLKEIQSSKNPDQIFDLCSKLMLRLRTVSIPTLCAVNGVVAAAGFQLAMGCDILLATQNSTFSCPGIKWGVFCSTPGVELVRTITSQKKANEMLLFGQALTAQQAFQYGIVNKVLENQEALNQQVENFIQKSNHLSSEIIKLGKQTLRKQKSQPVEQAYETAGKAMHCNVTQMADSRQGLAAFSQKRKPIYKH